MQPSKPHESQGYRLLHSLFTEGKRVFTMQDIKNSAKALGIPHLQLRKIVSNLAKQGKILRLRRGLYVGIGLFGELPAIHPFVISAYLIQPSAIGHWSALQHHGLTEQVPQIVTASTPRKFVTPSMRTNQAEASNRKHAFVIADIRYEYINIQQKHFFGLEKIWLDEIFQVSITDKERTLLDVFIYPKMFGGIGESLGILESTLADINIKKLIEYAVRYDNKSVAKRLGWALEYFGVATEKLTALMEIPMNFYCPLDPAGEMTGEYDTRWMIQNNLVKVKKS
jgi:predicted transcriptional regulator of viral defense system